MWRQPNRRLGARSRLGKRSAKWAHQHPPNPNPNPSSPYGSSIPSLFDLRIPYERTPSLPSSSRSRAMKGNTKSCITSHRCSDCEICNRCVAARPDPIRLLLRVHSPPPPRPLHTYCTKRFAESLGRELIIIKPNAVNVVMAPAAVVVRLDHRHTYHSHPTPTH